MFGVFIAVSALILVSVSYFSYRRVVRRFSSKNELENPFRASIQTNQTFENDLNKVERKEFLRYARKNIGLSWENE